MDQEDLYDEFGNYIGPEIESQQSSEKEEGKQEEIPEGVEQVLGTSNEHRIVLHEDKKFYISHEEMYPGAEIMI